jgi:hypothetical protein
LSGGHIAKDTAAGSDKSIRADFDSRTDKTIGGNPSAIADKDGGSLQTKSGVLAVVVAGTEVAILGNSAVLPDADAIETIEDHIISDPAIVTDFDFPGIGKAGGGADENSRTDPSAEQTQQPATEPMSEVGA